MKKLLIVISFWTTIISCDAITIGGYSDNSKKAEMTIFTWGDATKILGAAHDDNILRHIVGTITNFEHTFEIPQDESKISFVRLGRTPEKLLIKSSAYVLPLIAGKYYKIIDAGSIDPYHPIKVEIE